MLVPPNGYLERLRAICDKHGILLIFDEVITGFGRLGTAFAAERFGVTPDMIVFAKAITNGIEQRADLLNRVLGDLYGAQTLLKSGAIPPPVIFGHRGFLAPAEGLQPAGGRHLLQYAASDLQSSVATFSVTG